VHLCNTLPYCLGTLHSLIAQNHYLRVAVDYLFLPQHWRYIGVEEANGADEDEGASLCEIYLSDL
jgi:hypothetical protein